MSMYDQKNQQTDKQVNVGHDVNVQGDLVSGDKHEHHHYAQTTSTGKPLRHPRRDTYVLISIIGIVLLVALVLGVKRYSPNQSLEEHCIIDSDPSGEITVSCPGLSPKVKKILNKLLNQFVIELNNLLFAKMEYLSEIPKETPKVQGTSTNSLFDEIEQLIIKIKTVKLQEAEKWSQKYHELEIQLAKLEGKLTSQIQQAFKQGDLNKTGQLLEQIIGKQRMDAKKLANIHYLRSKIYELQYQPVERLQHLKKASGLLPDNMDYAYEYRKLLEQSKSNIEANNPLPSTEKHDTSNGLSRDKKISDNPVKGSGSSIVPVPDYSFEDTHDYSEKQKEVDDKELSFTPTLHAITFYDEFFLSGNSLYIKKFLGDISKEGVMINFREIPIVTHGTYYLEIFLKTFLTTLDTLSVNSKKDIVFFYLNGSSYTFYANNISISNIITRLRAKSPGFFIVIVDACQYVEYLEYYKFARKRVSYSWKRKNYQELFLNQRGYVGVSNTSFIRWDTNYVPYCNKETSNVLTKYFLNNLYENLSSDNPSWLTIAKNTEADIKRDYGDTQKVNFIIDLEGQPKYRTPNTE